MQNDKEIYQKELEKRDKTIEALSLQVELFKHQLDYFKRLIHGSKHERFVVEQNPAQLGLGFDGAQQQPAIEQEEVTVTVTKKKKTPLNPPVRTDLPANLPRQIIVLEPDEDVTGLVMIGNEITEVLEIEPPKVYVKQYRRPKYARANGNGIAIAEVPSLPLPKSIAGPTLLAYILTCKFIDHLPIFRLIKIFIRHGITISDSTINDWIRKTCALLLILYERLIEQTLATGYIQLDETHIRVLDRTKKGKCHMGYFWVCYSPQTKLTAFQYYPGRGQVHADEILKNFKGNLQTDGYGVYDNYANRTDITVSACMTHTRRYFDKALSDNKVLAEHFLGRIQVLYALEERIRRENLNEDKILELRKEIALPVMDELKVWLQENFSKTNPTSPSRIAISYALGRWDKLTCYIYDAKLQIDTNLVENVIRPVALGRKNYMFAGSHDGAKRYAMFYTFFACCKANNVNPLHWLTDVLTRIQDTPVNNINSLLPQNWAATNNI